MQIDESGRVAGYFCAPIRNALDVLNTRCDCSPRLRTGFFPLFNIDYDHRNVIGLPWPAALPWPGKHLF